MTEPARATASFEDFVKLDIRVAKVLTVQDHPNADKLLVLTVDIGGEPRQIIAGLKPYCEPQSLVGKNIVVLANLEPRKMRGLDSNGMLLAASWGEGDARKVTVLTTLDPETPSGSPVS